MSGPPRGNLNQAKNGRKIDRKQLVNRLVLGELPANMRRQLVNCRKYRRGLEALVLESKGEVSAVDAHWIDEATSCEVHASVCKWLLRTRLEKMSVADVTRCSEQIIKAKAARNKAVKALGLDRPPADPWDALNDAQTEGPANG